MNIITNLLMFFLAFSLPFHYTFNNWILGICYIVFVFNFVNNREIFSIKSFYDNGGVSIVLFFLVILIGITYSQNPKEAYEYLVRVIPMLLSPLLFMSCESFYKKYSKYIFKGLILGCLIAVLICWGNVLYGVISNNEPISYIFRHRHLNNKLTEIIGIHPSYLSLFVVTSIAIIINIYETLDNRLKLISKILINIFTVFLFTLLARNILFFYLISVIVFLIINRKWKLLTLIGVFILLFISIVFKIDDQYNYLRKKVIYSIPLLGDKGSISRFDRLKATKYMFLQHPIFGVGTCDSKYYRQNYYLETNDKIAYEKEYNAHNQFFEYLDELGIIGGAVYLLFFIQSFRLAFRYNDFLLGYITLLFFVSNLTESMLQRTHGVVYFSLIFSLIFSKYISQKPFCEV